MWLSSENKQGEHDTWYNMIQYDMVWCTPNPHPQCPILVQFLCCPLHCMQRASSALQYFKLVPCQVAVVRLRSKVSWQFCCIGMSNKVPGTLEYLEYLEYLGHRKTTPMPSVAQWLRSARNVCWCMGNVRASTSNLNRVNRWCCGDMFGHFWHTTSSSSFSLMWKGCQEDGSQVQSVFSTFLYGLALRCRAPNHSSFTPDSKQCWTRTQILQVKFSWPGFTKLHCLPTLFYFKTNK